MNNILILSLILIINQNLFSDNLQLKKIPLDNKFLSTENGGDKYAIDAYSDGIGIYTIGLENKKSLAMNELVFVHGEEAKKNGESLKEFVLSNGDNTEQKLANILGTNDLGTLIGATCEDGNSNTIGDVYIDTNGTCKGTEIDNNNIVILNNGIITCDKALINTIEIKNNIEYYIASNKTDLINKINEGFIANNICTTKINSMAYLFQNNKTFNEDIYNWDVSNVTDMRYMFANSIFNKNINNWDVSNVTNMNQMFINTLSFNQPLNNWNTKSLKTLVQTFANSNFNQDIKSWNISNVTSLSGLFNKAINFNQPLNNWDTSNVVNLVQTFSGATSFNQDISNWNVSKVTDMRYLFSYTDNFNQNINNWNTSNVVYMSNMFLNAKIFNQPLNYWDTSKVKSMDSMFSNATSFNQNISNWNVSLITNKPYNFDYKASTWNSSFKPIYME